MIRTAMFLRRPCLNLELSDTALPFFTGADEIPYVIPEANKAFTLVLGRLSFMQADRVRFNSKKFDSGFLTGSTAGELQT